MQQTHPEHLQANSIGRLHFFEGHPHVNQPHVRSTFPSTLEEYSGLDSTDSDVFSSQNSLGFGQQPSSYSTPWEPLSVRMNYLPH
jgi:hypothetical protein